MSLLFARGAGSWQTYYNTQYSQVTTNYFSTYWNSYYQTDWVQATWMERVTNQATGYSFSTAWWTYYNSYWNVQTGQWTEQFAGEGGGSIYTVWDTQYVVATQNVTSQMTGTAYLTYWWTGYTGYTNYSQQTYINTSQLTSTNYMTYWNVVTNRLTTN